MRARYTMAIALLLALGACGGSPPTQFYTLDPVPSRQRGAAVNGPPVSVTVVHVPPELDRLSMVRENTANQLEIDDQDRWAAPISDIIRQTLAEDLATRLAPGSVLLPDAVPPPAVRTIAIDIVRFLPDASGRLVLDASWSLLDAGSRNPTLRRQAHLESTLSTATGADQATAMSRLLGLLADSISDEIAGSPR